MKKVKSKSKISLTESTSSKDNPQSWCEKIVLPDECGDTLWEEVLAQKNNDLLVRKSNENNMSSTAVNQEE